MHSHTPRSVQSPSCKLESNPSGNIAKRLIERRVTLNMKDSREAFVVRFAPFRHRSVKRTNNTRQAGVRSHHRVILRIISDGDAVSGSVATSQFIVSPEKMYFYQLPDSAPICRYMLQGSPVLGAMVVLFNENILCHSLDTPSTCDGEWDCMDVGWCGKVLCNVGLK